MVGFETQEVERKALSILRVLSDSQEPLGARVIARHLKDLRGGTGGKSSALSPQADG